MGKCKDCGNCKRLYRRVMLMYFGDRRYYCTEKEETTDRESSCDKWTKKRRETDLSKKRFDGVENDISYIAEFCRKFDK